ncbi:MAG: hypothetical protein MUO63_04945, partial [Desulfobulbaceae bacterium]|nr:hypothetical protein [Desulfobulbaceae bacterium]
SQVLTVFFFGICSMVLQMEIDSLCNFHDAPPVGLESNRVRRHFMIAYLTRKLRGRTRWASGIMLIFCFAKMVEVADGYFNLCLSAIARYNTLGQKGFSRPSTLLLSSEVLILS